MNEQDWITPEERQKHFDKYEGFALLIGIDRLKELVPFTVGQVKAALDSGDLHLNTLPLKQWDACHSTVRRWAGFSGMRDWPLSYTVCVLKHVARYHYT